MPKPSRYEPAVRDLLRGAASEGGLTASDIASRTGAGMKETYRLLAKLKNDVVVVGHAPGGARKLALREAQVSRRTGAGGSATLHEATLHGGTDAGVMRVGDQYVVARVMSVDAHGGMELELEGPGGRLHVRGNLETA